MQQWGLAEKRDASFSSLSGGQKQKLFIALSLVNNPALVFLDEMTTGLDPAARRIAWDLIRSVRERGATVVLVTHFMDEAEKLCDRVAVVDRGKVIDVDSPGRLITKFAGDVCVIFTAFQNDVSWLETVPCVKKVTMKGPRVEVEGNGPVLAQVAAALVAHGIIPEDLYTAQPSLEDVFLKITGHSSEE